MSPLLGRTHRPLQQRAHDRRRHTPPARSGGRGEQLELRELQLDRLALTDQFPDHSEPPHPPPQRLEPLHEAAGPPLAQRRDRGIDTRGEGPGREQQGRLREHRDDALDEEVADPLAVESSLDQER
ncbi:MAG: hypothetical protein IPO88_27255 [Nannocystis sp.]|uniref:hypothetical protein n=1 Tax=Nannocystis sp. TaxID=1962667 RepID=UPI0024275732|nr:hypothetical protein [Nannocystis sp.]MBK9757129.1 hypothetical protein [Nannocystis sp.]